MKDLCGVSLEKKHPHVKGKFGGLSPSHRANYTPIWVVGVETVERQPE